MSEPLVSVVIPIYNVEDYLDKCISSVVGQTYRHLEIILVDDGATDNCPRICDEWAEKDSRIRVIHKKNAGLGMARNTGIDNATGDYIFFFDSDDTVDLSTVEKCLACAETTGAGIIAFYGCDVYDNGDVVKKKIPSCKQMFEGESVINEFLPGLFSYEFGFGVSSCMKMFNLQILKNSGIRYMSEREIISEDAFFALQLCSKMQVAYILPEQLYYYYKRSNSLTKTFKADRQVKNDLFINKCLDYIEKEKLPSQVATHIKVRYQLYTIEALKQILRSDMSKKDKKDALKSIFTSSVLISTLTKDVLSIHNKSLQVFFTMLRYRCYGVCRLLLQCKVKG